MRLLSPLPRPLSCYLPRRHLGATPRTDTPEDLGYPTKTDPVRWGKLIKGKNIQVE